MTAPLDLDRLRPQRHAYEPGQLVGALTVVKSLGVRLGKSRWLVECRCGNRFDLPGSKVRTTKGCMVCSRSTHRQPSEYVVWSSLKQRCLNPKAKSYPNYGGRGITVCDRWRSFEAFFADMGPRPSARHSIDRVDNNGPYSPANCRWATAKEQMGNTRLARLTVEDGRRMLELIRSGRSRDSVAKEFGVSNRTAQSIATGEWRGGVLRAA